MMQYKKVLGALTILGALAAGSTAFAQTASTTTTTDPTITTTSATTPTAPNTGAGGSAAENYALLGGSALVLVAGATYLARKRVIA
jgi:hypothetical protein